MTDGVELDWRYRCCQRSVKLNSKIRDQYHLKSGGHSAFEGPVRENVVGFEEHSCLLVFVDGANINGFMAQRLVITDSVTLRTFHLPS